MLRHLSIPLLFILLIFIGDCTSHKTEKVVNIGYMQVSTGLPLFVALEQKMFEREGLKVETIQFESVNEAMNSLLTGRIDCIQGVGFTTFMAVEQNVTDQFKLIWSCADTKEKFTSGLLKRKGLPYSIIEDLKKKKIGTYTGTSQLINLKVILRNLKINPDKDVEIIQVGRQIELQAFSSGQFDFLFTIEPDVTIAIEKNIGEVFIQNPRVKYIFDPFVAGGAVVSTKFINERKDDLTKLIKVANESIDYIRLHEQEAKSFLPKYTPLTIDIAQKSGLYEFWKLGEENRSAMQALADLYLKEGDLKKPVNTSGMILSEKY